MKVMDGGNSLDVTLGEGMFFTRGLRVIML